MSYAEICRITHHNDIVHTEMLKCARHHETSALKSDNTQLYCRLQFKPKRNYASQLLHNGTYLTVLDSPKRVLPSFSAIFNQLHFALFPRHVESA